jgi:hypothetical protein
MRMKILFGVVTLAVFAGGPILRSYIRQIPQSDPSQAYARQEPAPVTCVAPRSAPAENDIQIEPAPAPAATPEAAQVSEPVRESDSQPAYRGERAPQPFRQQRNLEHQALIVGGGAAAGSAIRAVAGGGKGAAVGALSGGVAGLTYDLLTRNQ